MVVVDSGAAAVVGAAVVTNSARGVSLAHALPMSAKAIATEPMRRSIRAPIARTNTPTVDREH